MFGVEESQMELPLYKGGTMRGIAMRRAVVAAAVSATMVGGAASAAGAAAPVTVQSYCQRGSFPLDVPVHRCGRILE